MITITPIYAAILTFLYIYLAGRVISVRRGERISLGDGNKPDMEQRIRVHANFAEYAPLALLLMLMVELQGGSAILVHVLGLLLLAGRSMHAYGVSQNPQVLILRMMGMVSTFAVLIIGAVALLVNAVN